MRSLREDSRARFPIILRTALVLLILLIFFNSRRMLGYSNAPGRELFFMVMMLNCAFIAITALSIFPSSIAEEKEDETLTLLRMTNLSVLAILFGKSTSRLMTALLLLVVQVPFTLLCVTLGGVSQEQVWSAYAILGAATFFLCNLGLLASTYCKTTLRAGFLTGLLGGIVYVAFPFFVMVSSSRRIGMGGPGLPPMVPHVPDLWEKISGWILQANPVWALGMLLENRVPSALLIHQIWTSLGAGLCCFLFSWLIFDRYTTKTGEESARPRMKNREGKVRRLARVPRPGLRLPLAWKDFHFMIGGRFGIYLRLAIALVGFGAVYAFVHWEAGEASAWNPYRASELRQWRNVCEMCIAGAALISGLEILLLAGRIFGVERRRLTLSSLVGLPWKPGKIIRQKLLGCLPALFPWMIVAGLAIAFYPDLRFDKFLKALSEVTWRDNREEFSLMIYVALQALLLLVTIVWFSLRIRRGALPCAIVILGVWNFVFALIVAETRNSFQYLTILVGVWLTLPVLILLARAVYHRLQLVAAEE
jgi:ABC-type transport system involved in multi-copper enzyme maturation permease subunit